MRRAEGSLPRIICGAGAFFYGASSASLTTVCLAAAPSPSRSLRSRRKSQRTTSPSGPPALGYASLALRATRILLRKTKSSYIGADHKGKLLRIVIAGTGGFCLSRRRFRFSWGLHVPLHPAVVSPLRSDLLH